MYLQASHRIMPTKKSYQNNRLLFLERRQRFKPSDFPLARFGDKDGRDANVAVNERSINGQELEHVLKSMEHKKVLCW